MMSPPASARRHRRRSAPARSRTGGTNAAARRERKSPSPSRTRGSHERTAPRGWRRSTARRVKRMPSSASDESDEQRRGRLQQQRVERLGVFKRPVLRGIEGADALTESHSGVARAPTSDVKICPEATPVTPGPLIGPCGQPVVAQVYFDGLGGSKMTDLPYKGRRWISGREVEGNVSLPQFLLNFTLLSHAGWSGFILVVVWILSYLPLWTAYNFYIFGVILVFFGALAYLSQGAVFNISSKKLTFKNPGNDFDWIYYAKLRTAQMLGLFCLTCALLIWGTGGLSSPFIPFYVMVFLLAFNYCGFPQPVTTLTLTFVSFFLLAILFSEVPWIHQFVPVPIDDTTQAAINRLYRRKLFEAAFVILSMLVPLISWYLAAWRTGGDGDGLSAAAGAVASRGATGPQTVTVAESANAPNNDPLAGPPPSGSGVQK